MKPQIIPGLLALLLSTGGAFAVCSSSSTGPYYEPYLRYGPTGNTISLVDKNGLDTLLALQGSAPSFGQLIITPVSGSGQTTALSVGAGTQTVANTIDITANSTGATINVAGTAGNSIIKSTASSVIAAIDISGNEGNAALFTHGTSAFDGWNESGTNGRAGAFFGGTYSTAVLYAATRQAGTVGIPFAYMNGNDYVQWVSPYHTAAGVALPACGGTYRGAMAVVSDATAPTYNGTYVSGGAVTVPVFCDGTNWKTH